MSLYSAYVARRATGRVAPPRNGDLSATPRQLLDALTSGVAVLRRLLDGMSPTDRAFHPSGLADRDGWIGMACTELLVHTYDIATATGASIVAPSEMADAIVTRVLPWTPSHPDGWARLLAATGRRSVDGLPAAGPDWWWHPAPLAEWDGHPHLRSTPPQW